MSGQSSAEKYSNMNTEKGNSILERKEQILQDIEKKALDQCNISFLLMGGIPLIIFIYLIGIKLFSWNLMSGIAGDLLLVAFLSAMFGLVFARIRLKGLIELIMSYNKLLIEKEKEIQTLRQVTVQAVNPS